jgi:hypothetical protein
MNTSFVFGKPILQTYLVLCHFTVPSCILLSSNSINCGRLCRYQFGQTRIQRLAEVSYDVIARNVGAVIKGTS